ncbi:hypothetical protein FKM82_027044 [Ascaphus truei]
MLLMIQYIFRCDPACVIFFGGWGSAPPNSSPVGSASGIMLSTTRLSHGMRSTMAFIPGSIVPNVVTILRCPKAERTDRQLPNIYSRYNIYR